MKRNLVFTVTLAAILVFAFSNSNAQTKDDAGNAYNAARTLSSTDKAGALKSMKEVISMCEKIGPDADEIKKMAVAVIPDWQYQIANDLLKEKKYDDAITAYEQTITCSEKYNDPEKKEKSIGQLSKLHFIKGQESLKADNADAAIASYNKAIEYDPEYTKAFFSLGAAYKNKNDFENMQKAMDKANELGIKTNDTATAAKAREAMATSFLSRANKSFSSKNYTQAIELANSSLKYDDSNAPAYLILTVSYNSQSKFDQALESAQKGLAIESRPEKQSDFYFQIGKAYEGKKDNANACSNYKKVTSGPNKPAAEYQMKTVLKCS